jgi:hypothetical protein
MLIVFAGSIGRSGVGGLAWAQMQYLVGFRELGHDVVYLEDCGEESWVYHWEEEGLTTDLKYPAAYVRDSLEPLGLQDRWAYRAGPQSEGLSIADIGDMCADADLLISWADHMGAWRPEYDLPKRRAFVDVDPGFTQIGLLQGDPDLTALIEHFDRLFTIAPGIGRPESEIPPTGIEWHHLWPPVALSHWPAAEEGAASHFTSVMKWRGFRDVEYRGRFYGQKDREFPTFIELPSLTDQPIRLAHLGADADELGAHGWEVVPGEVPSSTPWTFREFVQDSRAEFGIAKHGYVKLQDGWFSDRSVCYLASGRPLLLEDTGLERYLPIGEGIVLFRTVQEAVRGIEEINADYERHRGWARQMAEDYFATEKVLPRLLEVAST